jgi:demethylmenaquinone methyltransferase/2-methoxy-6-polyprenyl-1,4-benzoquinol methylase
MLIQGLEALPLADASVDFVSMGYALRHVRDLAIAFAEFGRVLRPGGRLLILEIGAGPSEVHVTISRPEMRQDTGDRVYRLIALPLQ